MDQLLDIWRDPHARHAMLVHLPIGMAMVGVVPVLVLAVMGGRLPPDAARAVRIGAICCFLLGSGGAYLAADAGHAAARRVLEGPLSAQERAMVERHAARGGPAWIWPLLPAAMVGAGLSARPRVRAAGAGLAVVSSIGVAVWFGVIGHVGGRLVYVHGIGVPGRDVATTPRVAPPLDTAGAIGDGEP